MNKTLLFAATLAGALGVAASAAAQPKLVKKWESEASFKVPESVYIDKAGKVLYVSNIDGEPWGKDGAGSIGKLGLDGKVIAAVDVTSSRTARSSPCRPAPTRS